MAMEVYRDCCANKKNVSALRAGQGVVLTSSNLCSCASYKLKHNLIGCIIGLARTIYIRCIHSIFDREITKYTVIYGIYTRTWPTLYSTCGR